MLQCVAFFHNTYMHKRQDGAQGMLAAGPQYIAVCCSVLQCVSVCCSVLQCVALFHNTYIYIDGRIESR